MTNTAINLDLSFFQAVLIERAIEAQLKEIIETYTFLKKCKADGMEVHPTQFEDQLFFFSELNKQRRLLRVATKPEIE